MHQAHTLALLPGRLAPLDLPPSNTAPKPIARKIEQYRSLVTELRSAQAQRRDLDGGIPAREADARDARGVADGAPPTPTHRERLARDREAARLAVAALEVRLDDTLVELLDALDKHGQTWGRILADAQADATARTTEALAVVEAEGTRLTELRRLADWLSRFPEHRKWAGQVTPIPSDLATPISTLARYLRGDITVDQIGIRPPAT